MFTYSETDRSTTFLWKVFSNLSFNFWIRNSFDLKLDLKLVKRKKLILFPSSFFNQKRNWFVFYAIPYVQELIFLQNVSDVCLQIYLIPILFTAFLLVAKTNTGYLFAIYVLTGFAVDVESDWVQEIPLGNIFLV